MTIRQIYISLNLILHTVLKGLKIIIQSKSPQSSTTLRIMKKKSMRITFHTKTDSAVRWHWINNMASNLRNKTHHLCKLVSRLMYTPFVIAVTFCNWFTLKGLTSLSTTANRAFLVFQKHVSTTPCVLHEYETSVSSTICVYRQCKCGSLLSRGCQWNSGARHKQYLCK